MWGLTKVRKKTKISEMKGCATYFMGLWGFGGCCKEGVWGFGGARFIVFDIECKKLYL